MTFWNTLFGWMSNATPTTDGTELNQPAPLQNQGCIINPATTLPMFNDDYGGFDVGGSPYGLNVHDTGFSSSDPFNQNQ